MKLWRHVLCPAGREELACSTLWLVWTNDSNTSRKWTSYRKLLHVRFLISFSIMITRTSSTNFLTWQTSSINQTHHWDMSRQGGGWSGDVWRHSAGETIEIITKHFSLAASYHWHNHRNALNTNYNSGANNCCKVRQNSDHWVINQPGSNFLHRLRLRWDE